MNIREEFGTPAERLGLKPEDSWVELPDLYSWYNMHTGEILPHVSAQHRGLKHNSELAYLVMLCRAFESIRPALQMLQAIVGREGDSLQGLMANILAELTYNRTGNRAS